ncbi:sensor histidine kinase [Pseudomonas neustonica]|uniref:sensor histidine kinase n=1 Tax=Pseudomonas neustonica TaxID=2487346 RepID=UPI003F4497D3
MEAFSYSVSHDLRAPLRAIDGFSNILLSSLSEKLNAQETDYFNRIRAAANKMSTLIDDLLMLARVTRADVSLTAVNLSELAEKVVQSLRDAEPERRVQVDVQKNLLVNGDPVLLAVAIENLISNAWKFTAKVDEPHIRIEEETRDGEKVVAVSDNGAGFDMEYADKLFTPFQRLHSASDFPGTGIGLATIARIMAKLDGRVWAAAEPGKGASFYLKFNSVRNTL